jgi:hypothetical protein
LAGKLVFIENKAKEYLQKDFEFTEEFRNEQFEKPEYDYYTMFMILRRVRILDLENKIPDQKLALNIENYAFFLSSASMTKDYEIFVDQVSVPILISLGCILGLVIWFMPLICAGCKKNDEVRKSCQSICCKCCCSFFDKKDEQKNEPIIVKQQKRIWIVKSKLEDGEINPKSEKKPQNPVKPKFNENNDQDPKNVIQMDPLTGMDNPQFRNVDQNSGNLHRGNKGGMFDPLQMGDPGEEIELYRPKGALVHFQNNLEMNSFEGRVPVEEEVPDYEEKMAKK